MHVSNKCEFNPTAKQGTISLLEKPNKDQLDIINWRPLTMLCCDYKIYAKVIANRLQSVIATIIHEDQRGFIKTRQISHNVMELLSTIEYCNQENTPAFAMAVDFEKAFDRVEWPAMEKILKKFNFGPIFISYVRTCIVNFENSVSNNAYRTNFYKMSRGLKQGCPLSPQIFDLVIETIALKLRQNTNIKGIQIDDVRKVLSQFADDIWVVSEYDQRSYEEILLMFHEFYLFSGLIMNYNKTEILRIGSLRHSNAMFYSRLPLVWSDGPVKVLGFDVFPDLDKTIEYNYNDILGKIKSIIITWQKRNLSLLGKVTIANTLLLTQAIYKLQVLPIPKNFAVKFRKCITQFLWDQKPARIKYDQLIQTKDNGGLGLQDIHAKSAAFQAGWIYNFPSLSIYLKKISCKLTNCVMNEKCNSYNLSSEAAQELLNSSSVLWKAPFLAWAKFNYHKPTSKKNIMSQCIRFNSNIKISKYYNNLKVKWVNGLEAISDIMLENGSFIAQDHFWTKFNTGNFILYNAIKNAIPKEWSKIVNCNMVEVDTLNGIDKVQRNMKSNPGISVTKSIYLELLPKVVNFNKRAK